MSTHHPHHHTNALLLRVAKVIAPHHANDSDFHALIEAAEAEHDQHVAAHAEAHPHGHHHE